MKKSLLLGALLFVLCNICFAQDYSVIESDLQQILNRRSVGKASVNILFKSKIDADYLKSKIAAAPDKKNQRDIFVEELKTFSANAQADVLSYLQAEEANGKVANIKSHWITNVISCDATAEVIYALSQLSEIEIIGHDAEQKIVQEEENIEQLLPSYESYKATPHVLQINADDVWNLGYTGKNVVVAVLDSGINPEHYDLKDHLWCGYADTDGDGEKDDIINGWNFIADNENITDDYGHGTHCAGIVCGDGTYGNITGVAPDATLMTVKVVNRAGGGTPAQMISGVEFAIANGANILSMSLGFKAAMVGTSVKESLRETFVMALNAGVIVCAAAGNDGENQSTYPVPGNVDIPAACPPPYMHPDQAVNEGDLSSVVCVGAVDEYNNYASFSSVGPVTWQDTYYGDYPLDEDNIGLIRPDICAPGKLIYSLNHSSINKYKLMSGTSQATPCVAGVMALMLEKNPNLTPAEICRIIETTAVKLAETKNNYTGSGAIDALAAVNAVETANEKPFIRIVDYTPAKITSSSNNVLNIRVANTGKGSLSEQATMTLSVDDPYMTLSNSTVPLEQMATNEMQTATFGIVVSNELAFGHTIYLTATIEDGALKWVENITLTIEAEPKIVYSSSTPAVLKAGEDVTLSVDIINKGNAPTISNTDVQLTTNSPYVTIVQNIATVAPMAVDEVATVDFVVNVSQEIPDNSNISFDIYAVPNNYTDVKNLSYEFEIGMDDDGYLEDGFCGWTTFDASNDGRNHPWWHSSNYASCAMETVGTAHSGYGKLISETYCHASMSLYTMPIDNYLVSPQIRVTENSKMSFMARYHSAQFPLEHFGLAVSEARNTSSEDFSLIQEWTIEKEDGDDWIEFNVDLSAYAGKDIYVAIRHFYTEEQWNDPNVDQGYNTYALHVDDVCFHDIIDVSQEFIYHNYSYFSVKVESEPLPAPADVVAQMVDEQSISLSWSAVTNAQSYNIYRNGEYIANTANVNYTDTGLNSATEYNYCVAAVYNGKVYEASAEVSATTDKADYNVVVKSYSPATLSPGENTLYVTMLNNGRYELHTKCTVTFSCDDPYVTINSGNFTIAALSPDATAEKSITLTVSDAVPNGHVVNFAVNVKEQYSPYYNWDFTSSIVVYNEDAVDISEQRATAKALVDGWGGVGYPVASAVEEYLAAVDAANHAEDITAAQTALLAAEIQMPEDGKAYTFTNVQKGGSEFVMGYDANDQMAFKDVVTTAEFICRDLGDGKYAFVDNNGHYLIWKGGSYNYNTNGYTDTYDSTTDKDWNDITIAPMNSGDEHVLADSQLDVMGFVALQGRRNDAGTKITYFVIRSDREYDAATASFYKAVGEHSGNTNYGYSSAFRMKEVAYANKPTLNSIGGSTLITNFEQEALATFSAPFPTVLPEGVTAFYAKRDDCNSEVISLTAYEGDALPANQGFILAGDAGAITMVPAAGETTVDISGQNVMGHSAGAAKQLNAYSGYILAGGSQGPGFYATGAGTLAMNKAYLALSGTDLTGMRSVVIRFPGLTDIDRVTVDGIGMDDAVIYDLSGRRVDNPSRGIYIVNGKKLYVK
ncbi:MAG: hypothetical protein E7090_08495 [Bacteroidales bacterium]|nr:hypothetical protein [Bacteroidales bacterium]